MSRKICASLFFFLLACACVSAYGQDAQIQGRVSDSGGAVIPKAIVRVVDQQTNTEHETATNGAGQYAVAGLTPSQYKVFVSAPGFVATVSDAITLNVGQNATLDFALKVGSTSSEVVVNGSDTVINTSDASVSTVVDREFVRDMPLNGRSFQSLVMLAPGVVTSTPQGDDDGGFSVNGQRTNSNRWRVDDLSAENAAYDWGGTATSGTAASTTSLGTTQAMIPVDALQEFRISTSSTSAEYGRGAGAQISMQSRSGTNTYHGDLYDYLRNYAFDANDWFNTYTTPIIQRPAERQNDFGGAIGGPVSIPLLFSGKDRLFFFGAYEGVRLTLPQNATIYYVPSNGTLNVSTKYASPLYKNLRVNAGTQATGTSALTGTSAAANAVALREIMNGFPLPNCVANASEVPSQLPSGVTSVTVNPQCVDNGDGLSPYIFSVASPAYSNVISIRADYQVTPGTRAFARYSDAPSNYVDSLADPEIDSRVMRTRAYVLGVDSVLRGSLANELRLQYSPSVYLNEGQQNLTGGAQPVNLNTLQGLPPIGGESFFEFDFAANQPKFYALNYGTLQFQNNVVDNLTWTWRAHVLKAGVDYRQTTTRINDGKYGRVPGAFTYFKTAASLLTDDTLEIKTSDAGRQDLTARNLGLYFEDTWRIHPRLTLNLGLRWDYNPSPTVVGTQQYTYTGYADVPSSLALSALGAPFYQNIYTDFQPRAGMAWVIHNGAGHETVLRAGGGLYYDLISADEYVGNASSSGYGSNVTYVSSSKAEYQFPFTAAAIEAAVPLGPPPYTLEFLIDPHAKYPSTVQWNVSLEQALGEHQSFNLGYVGTDSMNLIDYEGYHYTTAQSAVFSVISQYQNGPGSNYNALQAQYRNRLYHGLQALASYTWSHAIDWSSQDTAVEDLQRGNSNHDVRNNFTAALIYDVPRVSQNRLVNYVASNWDADLMAVMRSGFPVEQAGATVIDPDTGGDVVTTLNYNGKYPYIHVAGIPGGRQFNPAVFSVPATGTVGNAPRNFLRGFGEATADFAIQRAFPLRERLSLLFRAEAFNLFNHPNFGSIDTSCGTSTAGAVCNNTLFGQATETLSTSLSGNTGPPGLTSIYQQGGPRSLQFALKLQF